MQVSATGSCCCARFEHFITFFPHKLGSICGKQITTAELTEKLVHVTVKSRLEFIFKHCSFTIDTDSYVHAHIYKYVFISHL